VTLAGSEPSLKLNEEQHKDLNASFDGKAINVIREFAGRGTVVWGALTLDSDSNDFRYVQTRRTLIYVEQSIKAALMSFVFASNDGGTWGTVIAMISNFLEQLWSQRGLRGTTSREAFTVECGLGSTMTSVNVLQGYMIVRVTLQMLHPAQFIELTLKQTMQGA
jgi:phage tail sheath protein FI